MLVYFRVPFFSKENKYYTLFFSYQVWTISGFVNHFNKWLFVCWPLTLPSARMQPHFMTRFRAIAVKIWIRPRDVTKRHKCLLILLQYPDQTERQCSWAVFQPFHKTPVKLSPYKYQVNFFSLRGSKISWCPAIVTFTELSSSWYKDESVFIKTDWLIDWCFMLYRQHTYGSSIQKNRLGPYSNFQYYIRYTDINMLSIL